MCGIAGAFTLGGPRPPFSQATLDAMTDAMTHRGPDDRGTHLADGVAIGARRLSVIDVEDGHQPFASESGAVWAAQNGEIFNHDELRSRLGRDGHRFKSRCDTEVLPHLYEAHGNDFVDYLRGMFAVAVWDAESRRGVLVRDRLGIKPLYYAERDGLLLFASELKGLLASGFVQPDLDPEALEIFLTLGLVPAPRTLLAGVRKLPPGHRLVVEGGTYRVERYWSYPTVAGPRRGPDRREYAARLLEGLRESVKLRLISDVPLGAMLSGGLDSSLIVALMAEQMTEPVKTFSVGFAGSPTSELGIAREVASALGAEHHELEIEQDVPDLDTLVWHMDEPLVDLSALGFLALSGLAREHVTVALSGQGADELFAGYRHHLHSRIARAWEAVPGPLEGPLLRLASAAGRRGRRFAEVARAGDAVARSLAAKRISDPADVAALLGRPLRDGGAALAALRPLAPTSHDPLAAALEVDAQLGLPDDMLHYFDRASMAHSLEVRVPFLDHRFVEDVAQFPANVKLAGSTTKAVLRDAARGLVPDRVIDRPKVGFFNSSVDSWVSRAIERDGVERVLPENPRFADFVDRRAVQRVLLDGGPPTARKAQLLLALVLLETWLESYLPRAVAPARPSRAAVAAG